MQPNIEATRQLHERVAEVFSHNLSSNKPVNVTNSQYANLVELQLASKPTLSSENSHLFIPPFFDHSHVATIDKVDVTTEIQNNTPAMIYQIKWTEKAPKSTSSSESSSCESVRKVSVRQCFSSNSSASSTSSTSSAASSDSSEADSEPVPLVKKASSMMKICGKIRCDGPCAQIVEQTKTMQFGCDHVICEMCRKKSPSAALFDGSPGCCNESCIKMAKENGDKLCAGQSESQVSICSRVDAVESIPTHICILKNYRHDVLRTVMEFEYPSNGRLQMIVKSLAYYKDLIGNSRFYYCSRKPTHRSDLRPISLTDTNLRFYDIVDMKNGPYLYLIIVARDIQFC
ncbi:hypothetical protein B9Z55_008530 [Caenorhabditis nigoni]|uniref:Uncharacterized protein n=1 Tax=Caenorhabditis nigoni TaxID=1611254 RepID=A0A2G5UN22_9PELO|nr:hypothetical protein B9Z55_008530 [Caenorhabditis nigoni]